MEKITMKEFEERIAKDEALKAKAKETFGKGEEKIEKVKNFAASLGYELDLEDELLPVSDDEMDQVAGGGGDKDCNHSFVEIGRSYHILFDYIEYKCSKCGAIDYRFEWFNWD